MDTRDFFALDFHASLFPLQTNRLMIQHHHKSLEQYIAKILSDSPAHVDDCFLPQTRVHAAKPRNHLRRTTILDPVASYFLYDLIYRNRKSFGQGDSATRKSFGYRFTKGKPVPVHTAYKQFLSQVEVNALVYAHAISLDIASYFNSIYHHDATNWFASLPNINGLDANSFGRFFREINSGRSVDFLPHGIYPAKIIGSEFLRFIELSGQIKCAQSLRFMDDIHLFDGDEGTLVHDFHRVQELLGLRALNVNPTKTVFGSHLSVHDELSAIQQELEDIVEGSENYSMYVGSGIDASDFDDEDSPSLDKKQIERLLKLLVDPKAEESDVESILGILHEYTDSITSYIPHLLRRFPNIAKQLHKLAGLVVDKKALVSQLTELVKGTASLLEYQLFWMAVIAEDHLSETKGFGELILKLYEGTSDHKIARAKVLEIPDQGFGLKEIRDEVLKSGASDWPSWASAMGARTLIKAERNHVLKYFAKGSPINNLVAECVRGF
jgi:hypothetical protein